jgi:peptidylprolyl isomerase
MQDQTDDLVSVDVDGVRVTGALGVKPRIALPDAPPPAALVAADVVEGDGVAVPAAATVTTHYVGVSWCYGGRQFDASWDRGAPIQFPLSGVIQGWVEGIPGMRVGGRRLLVVPPALGYGAQPPTADIAPDDTLVFVIDMVASSR